MHIRTTHHRALESVTDLVPYDLAQKKATMPVVTSINKTEVVTHVIEELEKNHHEHVILTIGVDEAGRGPLLGSVVVGAAILPPYLAGNFDDVDLSDTAISQLNDSKKISEKKRNNLFNNLDMTTLAYSSVDVQAPIIDGINILQASLVGMKVASQAILQELAKLFTDKQKNRIEIKILFDGNKVPSIDYELIRKLGFTFQSESACAVVKGDAKHTSIAIASVIAKVTRDKQMYELARLHPEYGIEKHKGYPTKAHMEAIDNYGILQEHRRSYAPIKKILQK